MEERVEQLKNSLQTAGVYASRIADYFGVSIEHDGKGFVIEGETKDVLTARDVFVALDKLSSDSEIDETDISYLLNIAGEGRLEEFLKTSDEVFYMTPSGRAIKPRTLGQRLYVDSLKKTELVICCGPAGTGKTFLGVAMAVKALKSREVSKIILTRPAIEAGERLGFLPGDIEEKVNPYMRPIYDALSALLGQEMFERYYDKGVIEVSPLAFMRGRNLDDCFVLLDEAQNTTPEQMKMFLTRLGVNCRACVCGDFTQIDLPRGIPNGLKDAITVLDGVEGIRIVSLNDSDIVRNSLVARIVKAYENAKQGEL
ncbi:MAG: PhoH family protein [Clostridiales bacterium]|nr:PhoH family protein [Clostridiales bacterium]MBQ2156451.1 PhoH family protein [Clostridiales bacterium]MBQ5519422.1 PhoH family protein [Clostridiales bacterium]MBR3701102.1 PhoH family protein [Clostridiales bacterium]